LANQTLSIGELGRRGLEVTLRPAAMRDAEAIHALINAASRVSTVLPKTFASVCENLRDFIVAVSGDEVVGCGALHITTLDLAEIRSLVVTDEMRGRGLGGRIVAALVEEARKIGLKRLFVLTDSVDFFIRNGFRLTDKATLPHKVWNECILCPKFNDCGEVALDLQLGSSG
jgi:amino-acid N-acetyltransferase